MLKKTPKGYYVLEKFDKQKGLIHGFSGRKFGDCSPSKKKNTPNIEKFLSALGLKKESLVVMEQFHGNRIKVVGKKERRKIIPGVDGLVTKEKGVVLGVKTADCLPLLYYDSAVKIIGVAHAGWRGMLKRLPQKMIDLMVRLGSLPEEMMVGVGPFIGGCCYNIDARRVEGFKKEFGQIEGMITKGKNKTYLDLAVPTLVQLIHTGVPQKNIEFASTCTACQNKELFSYRKDEEKDFSSMLGVISLR